MLNYLLTGGFAAVRGIGGFRPATLMLSALVAFSAQAHDVTPEQEAEIEAFVRDYYERLETLDYSRLREVSTPDLEIISMSLPDYEIFGEGLHIGHEEFEKQVNAARKAGRELQIQLTQFNTRVENEVAYTSYLMYRANDDELGIGEMILLREGDQWRLARLVHTAFLPGYPE